MMAVTVGAVLSTTKVALGPTAAARLPAPSAATCKRPIERFPESRHP